MSSIKWSTKMKMMARAMLIMLSAQTLISYRVYMRIQSHFVILHTHMQ